MKEGKKSMCGVYEIGLLVQKKSNEDVSSRWFAVLSLTRR